MAMRNSHLRAARMDELREVMDELVDRYNRVDFIPDDPISVPHLFSKKEDVEISAFLSATIAWGNRKSIVRNARDMMERMDFAPFEFVVHAEPKELKGLDSFVHRTFNGGDFKGFIRSLRHIYLKYGGMEEVFTRGFQSGASAEAITFFRQVFLEVPHEDRLEKHVSDPLNGSSAKRINMFLRWMVRQDKRKVDFGIWRGIPMSALSVPLDVHTGRIAREWGLLSRKQNDARAVSELDTALRILDPRDPVKYDFALFGYGVEEKTRK